jgi:hypothetical protein
MLKKGQNANTVTVHSKLLQLLQIRPFAIHPCVKNESLQVPDTFINTMVLFIKTREVKT